MLAQLPRVISEAIATGTWQDPGPEALRGLLGHELELPDLELFKDFSLMRRISDQLDTAGYVDDPEFCIVREVELVARYDDPRLVFERALFIGGSTVPGDDVFVVLDLGRDSQALNVLVLDWRRSIPDRWVDVGALSVFVESLIPPAARS